MEFNIKDYIEKLKKRTEQLQPHKKEKEIVKIIESLGFSVSASHISLHNGILSFKNISPVVKTSIKVKQHIIKKKAAENDIIIRDII